MEDSRTITLYSAEGVDDSWQFEIFEEDSNGNMCVIVWVDSKNKVEVYAAPSSLRKVAAAILEMGG